MHYMHLRMQNKKRRKRIQRKKKREKLFLDLLQRDIWEPIFILSKQDKTCGPCLLQPPKHDIYIYIYYLNNGPVAKNIKRK